MSGVATLRKRGFEEMAVDAPTPARKRGRCGARVAVVAPAARLDEEEAAALARHVPRRLKRVVERVASGAVGPAEKVFTVADLRDIVTSVVAERETKLSEEFAGVLNDRLAEQFRDFTKFNEDYVTRQMRGREFTYLS